EAINFGEHQLSYRIGDVISPHLENTEPLRLELADFAASIRSGDQPRSSMSLGLDVLRIVDGAELSLIHNGAPGALDAPPHDRRHTPDRRVNGNGRHAASRIEVHSR